MTGPADIAIRGRRPSGRRHPGGRCPGHRLTHRPLRCLRLGGPTRMTGRPAGRESHCDRSEQQSEGLSACVAHQDQRSVALLGGPRLSARSCPRYEPQVGVGAQRDHSRAAGCVAKASRAAESPRRNPRAAPDKSVIKQISVLLIEDPSAAIGALHTADHYSASIPLEKMLERQPHQVCVVGEHDPNRSSVSRLPTGRKCRHRRRSPDGPSHSREREHRPWQFLAPCPYRLGAHEIITLVSSARAMTVESD